MLEEPGEELALLSCERAGFGKSHTVVWHAA
jgi:hypothetical protein